MVCSCSEKYLKLGSGGKAEYPITRHVVVAHNSDLRTPPVACSSSLCRHNQERLHLLAAAIGDDPEARHVPLADSHPAELRQLLLLPGLVPWTPETRRIPQLKEAHKETQGGCGVVI